MLNASAKPLKICMKPSWAQRDQQRFVCQYLVISLPLRRSALLAALFSLQRDENSVTAGMDHHR